MSLYECLDKIVQSYIIAVIKSARGHTIGQDVIWGVCLLTHVILALPLFSGHLFRTFAGVRLRSPPLAGVRLRSPALAGARVGFLFLALESVQMCTNLYRFQCKRKADTSGHERTRAEANVRNRCPLKSSSARMTRVRRQTPPFCIYI